VIRRNDKRIQIMTAAMEGVAGIIAPADGSFRGAGSKPAPSSYLPVENAPLRREVKGR